MEESQPLIYADHHALEILILALGALLFLFVSYRVREQAVKKVNPPPFSQVETFLSPPSSILP